MANDMPDNVVEDVSCSSPTSVRRGIECHATAETNFDLKETFLLDFYEPSNKASTTGADMNYVGRWATCAALCKKQSFERREKGCCLFGGYTEGVRYAEREYDSEPRKWGLGCWWSTKAITYTSPWKPDIASAWQCSYTGILDKLKAYLLSLCKKQLHISW